MDFWERLEKEVDSKIERKRLLGEVGVAPNSLTTWRKRKTYPAADVMVKIARILGSTVEYLVTGQDVSDLPPEFLSDCRLLSPEEFTPVALLAHASAVQHRAKSAPYHYADPSEEDLVAAERGAGIFPSSDDLNKREIG
ncbi:MAG TPA: helix-turn-helix domain-containing protein [Spirochaetia bacterium]|nr:helix-turn-helix domain-containing protein [Spirochaetia bacterium]